jgi:cell division septation protein DedD
VTRENLAIFIPHTTKPRCVATRRQQRAPRRGESCAIGHSRFNFYKTVEQNNANPQLDNPQSNSGTPNSGANGVNNPASGANGNAQSGANAAPPDASAQNDPAAVAPGNGYYVQVAAVSKQEDADALVEALKKKQYPAFSSNSQGDSFFHVQVGPYSDIKQAEDMRAKLVSDGYNPILKK